MREIMMEIREMDISDYHEVMNLWSMTEAMLLRDADSRENIRNYLSRNPGMSFVAFDNGKVIGAILVGTDGRRGYVQHLAISSSYRRQGIGAKLISRAVEALLDVGIAKTHLFVASENSNAKSFYEKLGWFLRDETYMYSFNATENSNV